MNIKITIASLAALAAAGAFAANTQINLPASATPAPEKAGTYYHAVPASPDGLPIINTRNTSASVNVRPNETITISGLRRDYVTRSDERVPILGYIPLVGYLFRHEIDVQRNSEILILLTPCEVGRDDQREHHMVDDLKVAGEEESAINKFVDKVILNKPSF